MKWLILVLVFVLASCSEDALDPLRSGDVVVAFGDSLTAGKGVVQDKAYPAVLSRLIGYPVVNAGISGETTAEGLQRLPDVLERENPALLILFEGGNDILRNQDLAKTKSNLEAMIQMAREREIEVVMVGLPRKQLFSNTAELYTQLADQYELPLQDNIVASLLRKPAMKSDNVHFNQDGYAALAGALAKLLKEEGALTD